MKKVKLPRKRKKQYIKDKSSLEYMSMRIVNELAIEDQSNFNTIFRADGFFKELDCYPNGAVKRVISYY